MLPYKDLKSNKDSYYVVKPVSATNILELKLKNILHNFSFCFSVCKIACKQQSMPRDADLRARHKEWDDALCPICMDHPHNAVLLLCSSHGKGCVSYICDTSYRHSNCLDRFKKLKKGIITDPPRRLVNSSHHNFRNELAGIHDSGENAHGGLDEQTLTASKLSLKCPLCRGDVFGWKVVEEARKYLNLKHRSCSRESCSFVGNYHELRRHARGVHPLARPGEIDPSRQRAWRRLEHQREYDDVVSSIHSAIPGAIVLGDYVIQNGDRFAAERDRSSGDVEVDGPWWTNFMFQMLGSMEHELRSRSRVWTRQHRRSSGAASGRRYLWGENLLGLQDEDDDDDDYFFNENNNDTATFSDVGEYDSSPIPRRRRRLTRSRSNGDQT
ncbi:hypothetical protein Nepgr_004364 [Nepenthes gracilis]|uniref:Uncharacterized protein n=1 Tax=Nepenthes gracilis TaxID=150966 RepID=A0AAD3S169_NEPGR|nr:hypothetical protein Nepgr_004364 [Nepenthes gracilis]